MSLSRKKKKFRYQALLNASAMIQEHGSGGLSPEDLGLSGDDEHGLELYLNECLIAAKRIETMARRFKKEQNL